MTVNGEDGAQADRIEAHAEAAGADVKAAREQLTAVSARVEQLTAATLHGLVEAQHSIERARMRLYRLFATGVLIMAASVFVVGFIAYQNREPSQDAARSAAIIVDCTTPSTPQAPHACYDRGQAQTIAALKAISADTRRTAVAAAACAANPATAGRVRQCVDKLIPLKGP